MSSTIVKSGVTLKAKKVDLKTERVRSIVKAVQSKQEKIIERKLVDSKKMNRVIRL